MTRVTDVINPIFREYAPVFNRQKIKLDLDLPDPLLETKKPRSLEKNIRKYLDFTLNEGRGQGSIIISGTADQIIIKDDSAVLSPEQRTKFTSDTTSIKSRLGFGTSLFITF